MSLPESEIQRWRTNAAIHEATHALMALYTQASIIKITINLSGKGSEAPAAMEWNSSNINKYNLISIIAAGCVGEECFQFETGVTLEQIMASECKEFEQHKERLLKLFPQDLESQWQNAKNSVKQVIVLPNARMCIKAMAGHILDRHNAGCTSISREEITGIWDRFTIEPQSDSFGAPSVKSLIRKR